MPRPDQNGDLDGRQAVEEQLGKRYESAERRTEAYHWFQKAANAGRAEAQMRLGNRLLTAVDHLEAELERQIAC